MPRSTRAWLSIVAGAVALGGIAGIWAYAMASSGAHGEYFAAGLLTAFACFLMGFLFGFLFGIPRVVSSGELRQKTTGPSGSGESGEQPAMSRLAPSSNLAEISDWLTKLLLGAGLVSLTRLGAPLGSLIDAIARGLHDPSSSGGTNTTASVVAGGILFCYTSLGFLVGYIVTTTWYQRLLERVACEPTPSSEDGQTASAATPVIVPTAQGQVSSPLAAAAPTDARSPAGPPPQ